MGCKDYLKTGRVLMDFISSFFNWGATKEEPIEPRKEPKIKNGREKTKNKFKRPIQKEKVTESEEVEEDVDA